MWKGRFESLALAALARGCFVSGICYSTDFCLARGGGGTSATTVRYSWEYYTERSLDVPAMRGNLYLK